MAALTVFVVAMIASYSGAFAKPTLHHLTVAVAGPQQVVDGIRGQDALGRHPGRRCGRRARPGLRPQDRRRVRRRRRPGDLKIYVAGGGGRSVANAAETVGRAIAAKAGLTPTVEDVAPTIGRRSAGHRRVLRRHLPVHRRHVGRQRVRLHDGQGAQALHVRAAHAEPGRLLGVAGRRGDPLRRRRARRADRPHLAGVRRAVAVRDGRRRCGDRRGGGVRHRRLGAS